MVDIEIPVAQAEVTTELNCKLSELSLDASGSSTGSGIVYNWTTTNGSIIGSTDVQNPTVNTAGTYQLLVSNIDNGCSNSTSVEVMEINEPVLSLDAQSDVACFGNTDGSASISVSGGMAPYNYNWSNGATDANVNNLSAGTYNVIVTDEVGCEDQIAVTIEEPIELLIDVAQVNNVCLDDAQGSIDLSISGGTDDYTYAWSNGMTSADLENLESGTYTVLVTDLAGCQKDATVEITTSDDIAPTVSTQDIIVSLDDSGHAVINTAMIDAGTFDNCGIDYMRLNQEAFDCASLGQNEVLLEVADLAGNMVMRSAMVTVIDEIAPVVNCVQDIVSNSCENIEYTMPSATDNCAALDPVLIEGLPSGSLFPQGTTMITYEVKDASGNTATCSFSVTVENTLESTFNSASISCFEESDGSITALPSGGTPGYTYQWDNGETTQMISDIPAGTYAVVITDQGGCQYEEVITLEEPDALEITMDNITNEMETGGNGAVEVSISGGTPGYTFQWTDSNGTVVSTEEDLLDVPGGIYTLMLTDANGCAISSESFNVDNIVPNINIDLEKYIKINPNPTAGEVNVSIELTSTANVQVSLLDITGRVLLDWKAEDISNKTYPMNLADFPNGVYLARVIVEGELYIQRVILAKK